MHHSSFGNKDLRVQLAADCMYATIHAFLTWIIRIHVRVSHSHAKHAVGLCTGSYVSGVITFREKLDYTQKIVSFLSILMA